MGEVTAYSGVSSLDAKLASWEAFEKDNERLEYILAEKKQQQQKLQETRSELKATINTVDAKTIRERENRANFINRASRLDAPVDKIRSLTAATVERLDAVESDIALYKSHLQELVDTGAEKTKAIAEIQIRVKEQTDEIDNLERDIKDTRIKNITKINQEIEEMNAKKAGLLAMLKEKQGKNKIIADRVANRRAEAKDLRKQNQQKSVLIAQKEEELKRQWEEDEERTAQHVERTRKERLRDIEMMRCRINDVKSAHQNNIERKAALELHFKEEEQVLKKLADIRDKMAVEVERNAGLLRKKAERNQRCDQLRAKIAEKKKSVEEIDRNTQKIKDFLADGRCEKLKKEIADVNAETDALEREIERRKEEAKVTSENVVKAREKGGVLTAKKMGLEETFAAMKLKNEEEKKDFCLKMQEIDTKLEAATRSVAEAAKNVEIMDENIRKAELDVNTLQSNHDEKRKLIQVQKLAATENEFSLQKYLSELKVEKAALQNRLEESKKTAIELEEKLERMGKLHAEKQKGLVALEQMQDEKKEMRAKINEIHNNIAANNAECEKTEAALKEQRQKLQEKQEAKELLKEARHDRQLNNAHINYLKQEQEKELRNNAEEEKYLLGEREKLKKDYAEKIEKAKKRLENLVQSFDPYAAGEDEEEQNGSDVYDSLPDMKSDPEAFVSFDEDSASMPSQPQRGPILGEQLIAIKEEAVQDQEMEASSTPVEIIDIKSENLTQEEAAPKRRIFKSDRSTQQKNPSWFGSLFSKPGASKAPTVPAAKAEMGQPKFLLPKNRRLPFRNERKTKISRKMQKDDVFDFDSDDSVEVLEVKLKHKSSGRKP